SIALREDMLALALMWCDDAAARPAARALEGRCRAALALAALQRGRIGAAAAPAAYMPAMLGGVLGVAGRRFGPAVRRPAGGGGAVGDVARPPGTPLRGRGCLAACWVWRGGASVPRCAAGARAKPAKRPAWRAGRTSLVSPRRNRLSRARRRVRRRSRAWRRP